MGRDIRKCKRKERKREQWQTKISQDNLRLLLRGGSSIPSSIADKQSHRPVLRLSLTFESFYNRDCSSLIGAYLDKWRDLDYPIRSRQSKNGPIEIQQCSCHSYLIVFWAETVKPSKHHHRCMKHTGTVSSVSCRFRYWETSSWALQSREWEQKSILDLVDYIFLKDGDGILVEMQIEV